MGTNFYWNENEEGQLPAGLGIASDYSEESPRIHIGKRSAAGLYCWDCGEPLCEEVSYGGEFYQRSRWSEEAVHGRNHTPLDACPACSGTYQPPAKGDLSTPGNPAGIELGFAQPLTQRPQGVLGASSFSWAQEPARVLHVCRRWPDAPLVRDGYDDQYTGAEFLDLILLIPMWWTTSIGTAFS